MVHRQLCPGAVKALAASGPSFRCGHRAEVAVRDGRNEDEGQGQERVEEVRNRGDENGEGAYGREGPGQGRIRARLGRGDPHPVGDEGDLVAHPGRYGDQCRHGCGGRVHDVCELLPGDLQAIRDGPHGVSDDECVRVVVEDDGQPCQPRSDLSTPTGAGKGAHGVDDALCASVAGHDPDQSSQEQREDHNMGVASVHVCEGLHRIRIDGPPERGEGVVSGHGQGAEPHAREEGGDDFLEEQSEQDGNQGRNEREPSGSERGANFVCRIANKNCQRQPVPCGNHQIGHRRGLSGGNGA